jgi:hypothetical protein
MCVLFQNAAIRAWHANTVPIGVVSAGAAIQGAAPAVVQGEIEEGKVTMQKYHKSLAGR